MVSQHGGPAAAPAWVTCWTVVLLACLWRSAAQEASSTWKPVELSCSVYTSGDWDFVNIGTASAWSTRCEEMVDRVKERCGGKKINFIATHYWVDTGDYVPAYFCYKFAVTDGSNPGGECREPTQENINQYQNAMASCMSKAIIMGYDLQITANLDDGEGMGKWRNMLDFDPLEQYGQWTYYDIMINPLVSAVSGVMRKETVVYLSMQSEASVTVLKYPSSYAYMSSLFIRPKPTSGTQGNVKVGVSMNFNKLAGHTELTNATKGMYDAGAVQQLFSEVDFIGIAAYSGWEGGADNLTFRSLENAVHLFQAEARWLGLDLSTLVNQQRKAFHLTQYGLGGGLCPNGTCPVSTADDATVSPFLGVYGPYRKDMDPWSRAGPGQLQRSFYNATLRWLAGGGGPTVRVDAAFVWNLASWDFAAIHPDGISGEGSYLNPNLTNAVKEFNRRVETNTLYMPPPPRSPNLNPPPAATNPPPPVVVAPAPPPRGGPSNQGDGNGTVGSGGGNKGETTLGVGAIAGIVAGVVVGLFVLVGLAIFVAGLVTGNQHQAEKYQSDNVNIFTQ